MEMGSVEIILNYSSVWNMVQFGDYAVSSMLRAVREAERR
jgi:hypothetical protein